MRAFDPLKVHVLDRFAMSDYVYSKVFGSPVDLEFLEKACKISLPYAKYIVCYKDINALQKDEIFDKQAQVRDAYLSFKNRTDLFDSFYLNTTDENLEAQLDAIDSWLKLN